MIRRRAERLKQCRRLRRPADIDPPRDDDYDSAPASACCAAEVAMVRLRILLSLTALLLAVSGLAIYRAARSVPEFYEEAVVAVPPAVADRQGDEFTATSVSLASQIRREGRWSAIFTDAQVNGWLTVDLPTKHPELLPPGYEQPRVRFTEHGLQLGVRCTTTPVTTVVWLDVDVQMTGAQEAALRFRRVRVGLLPLPLKEILDSLTQVASDLKLPLRWTTIENDPTAIVALPPIGDDGMQYDLDALKLSDGKLYVAGRTSRFAAKPTAAAAR
jgi:hypothetical protein